MVQKILTYFIGGSVLLEEFSRVLVKLCWYESPVINRVLPKMLKSLNHDSKIILLVFVKEWMEREDMSNDE